MHNAKKGDKIICPNCHEKIGEFETDCSDYKNIHKSAFEIPNKPPFNIPILNADPTRYGCNNCKNEIFYLQNGTWKLDAIVQPT